MFLHRAPREFEVLGNPFVASRAVDQMSDIANLVIGFSSQYFHILIVMKLVWKPLYEVGHRDAQLLGFLILIGCRTRAASNQYKEAQKLRIAMANLIKRLPNEFHDDEDVKILAAEADDKVCNIAHLIYRARSYEGIAKDFEFSRRTMEEHWQSGYDNARRTLALPQLMELPDRLEGVRTFDVCKDDYQEPRSDM